MYGGGDITQCFPRILVQVQTLAERMKLTSSLKTSFFTSCDFSFHKRNATIKRMKSSDINNLILLSSICYFTYRL